VEEGESLLIGGVDGVADFVEGDFERLELPPL
jgi:hypothetical protein